MFAHLAATAFLTLFVLAWTTPSFAQETAPQEPAQNQPKAQPTPQQPTPSEPPPSSKNREHLGHVQIVSVSLETGKLKLRVKKANNQEVDLFRPYSDSEASQLIVGRYICDAQCTVVNGEKQLTSPYNVELFAAACEQVTMTAQTSVMPVLLVRSCCVPRPAACAAPRRLILRRCR